VSFHDGEPGTYTLYSYTGDCSTNWNLGTFKVDANGDGSKVGSVDVSGYGNTFFADPFNETTDYNNESDIVKV
jgi:hypothetical protein